MRRLQRRRSAGLRPEPRSRVSVLRTAAAIAGDFLIVLIITGTVAVVAIFGGA